ncbi:MAG: pyridoxal phosphate-dependent aminotransferase [Haliscomenobacter sp.]|nr:pyridoxal phosphate-dependent aminotransferase [Haliscomenobacter sp.]MBP9075822.1 pyridoxal phosphate-dependent aminotransferase [Haliscomenobacter sp.]MBP9873941.1 pyridoxal phosphate-dependent aminotransferase [Haliscomenobacter sp.]
MPKHTMLFNSKLPNVGTTIFTVMSALAEKHGAINLAQGFPDFSPSERLVRLVADYLEKGYNQYAPMAGVPALRERIVEKIAGLYGPSLDPIHEVTITAGGTQAIFTAIAAFVHPGDEVILFEPAYDSYRPSIELAGGTAKAYELEAPGFRPDWEKFKRLISSRTRMIVINTPHNPSGTVLQQEDLLKLEQLLQGTDILVLSDEVYEHLIFDGRQHQSILRFPGLRERGLAVYSFGKTFHATGWKIGYCVAPAALMTEFRKVHQFNVFSVNTPIQHALADFMKDPHEYLGLGAFYHFKRDFFLDAMEGSRLKPLTCEGTYFLLCDYSAVSEEPDVEFARRMTVEYGVAAIPVSVFYQSPREERIIRLCFAKQDETLEKAGRLLRKI